MKMKMKNKMIAASSLKSINTFTKVYEHEWVSVYTIEVKQYTTQSYCNFFLFSFLCDIFKFRNEIQSVQSILLWFDYLVNCSLDDHLKQFRNKNIPQM